MPLVTYSDSEEEDIPQPPVDSSSAEAKTNEQSRKPPPILPTNFHALYASYTRSSTSDDPSLHGGRQRQIPHVLGNWPSFIYLEWLPSDLDLIGLDALIKDATSQLIGVSSSTGSIVTSSFRSELGVRLPLHVSLSTPLMLSTDNKDKFARSVKSAIHNSGVASFSVMPANLRWVHNFDKSRHFLILTLKRPENDELQELLTACNETAKEYELPELYAKGSLMSVGVPNSIAGDEDSMLPATTGTQDHNKFHISIGWTLHEPELHTTTANYQTDILRSLTTEFKQVHLRIGNQIHLIPLSAINVNAADTRDA